jgi:hypothetical protein
MALLSSFGTTQLRILEDVFFPKDFSGILEDPLVWTTSILTVKFKSFACV